jgi:hypothetical protein
MFDFDLQWLLLGLPLAFALGWIASRVDLRQWRRDERAQPTAYFKGLNYLLNEQPDRAIDAFIEAVQNDPNTTELHFALGNLFRRRGEFERAVRVHQHLLQRADLPAAERDRAQHALAQDYTKAGRVLADWIIAHDYTAHVLLIGSDEIVSTSAVVKGFETEMAKLGPEAQYKYFNVTVPEWGTKIQPQVQSAIVADPELTYVACIYDAMTQFVVPGVTAANAADQVKIIGFNANPFVIDFVREGKVEMTFGDSLNWAGWAIADAEMRIIDGQDIPVNGAVGEYLNNPFRMFTVDNAAEAGVPAEFSKGFGEYQAEYKTLWGLQ